MVYEDSQNHDKLIIDNIPLVKSVVNRIDGNNSGYDREDLINIGVIGLMDAINKFDGSKNVPFEAYARIRIRGAIIDELRRSGPVSRNRMEKLNKYNDAKKKLSNKNMQTPSELEVCDELGIDRDDLSQIHETVHYLSSVSLESLLYSDEGEDTELKDMLEDRNVDKPETSYEKGEISLILSSCIDKLEERDKILLNLYYVEELTMKEIAHVLDVSIPRVSQLHGQTINRLKELMTPELEVS